MYLRNIGKIVTVVTISAITCLTVMTASGATTPNAAPNVIYTANGTFSNPASSGADTLKLAGEPFTISITANAASVPIQNGPNWAVMSPFKMTGSVHSGLLGPTPVNIASTAASILQLVGPSYDIFICAFPVKVVGILLTINATIYMPPGTITTPLIHPFNPVTLNPGNATVIYSNGTDTTTLAVSSGTLTAALPGGNPTAGLTRQSGGYTAPGGPLSGEPAILVAFNSEAILKSSRRLA